MHYKILLTQSFRNDLDSALHYITTKLMNNIAASNLLKKTKETISALSDTPAAFPVYHGASKINLSTDIFWSGIT